MNLRKSFQNARVWKLVVADILLICTVLTVFIYFHLLVSKPIAEVEPGYGDAQAFEPIDIYSESSSDAEDEYENSVFTREVVVSENKYTSPNVAVELIDGVFTAETGATSTYHAADIYVKDIKYFRTVFAKDTYGRGIGELTPDMAERTGAICAINGDYYGTSQRNLIIRNGEMYGNFPKGNDICVLYSNGAMAVYSSGSFNADEAMANGAWQAWSFGPGLLDSEGNPLTKFNSSVKNNNPRSVVGCYEPGHYCFLAVDGRSKQSAGVTLKQLAALCSDMGMTCAYNLDGGRTTVMTFMDRVANIPFNNGRECSDFLCIFDPAAQTMEEAQ